MEIEKEEAEIFFLWIDWENKVISFHEAEGFEKLEYQTHKEMFEFAIEKSFEEFGIQ